MDPDDLPTFLGRGVAAIGALWALLSGVCVGRALSQLGDHDPWGTLVVSLSLISLVVGWAIFEGGRRI